MIIEYKKLLNAYIVYKRNKKGSLSMLSVHEKRDIALYKAILRMN